jgi:DNA-binding SARP family transcriptional activator/predicted ATPase
MQDDHKNGPATSPALQIRLLGAPEIILNDAPVTDLISVKAQALLFYLAATGRRHTRSTLGALLWGDVPEPTSRANLRKALQQLRRLFSTFLHIQRDSVSMDAGAGVWVDATELATALREVPAGEAPDKFERALSLFRGDFLAGFYVRNAPDFEDWWLSERERLRAMVLDGLSALADHYARQGELQRAIALIRRYLEIEPWREEAHRRLMAWLALGGERSAALAQLEICRRTLEDELGVEPAEETIALYARIRDGGLQPMRSTPSHTSESKRAPPAFLYRDAEPGLGLRERFVGGEAGWGKTHLLTAFSSRAQELYPDLVVAYGVCTAFTETGDPLLPFREILRMLAADVEHAWAAGRITRHHAVKLWDFLPQVVAALTDHGRRLIDTLVPGNALLQRAAAHDVIGPELRMRLQETVANRQAGEISGIDQERIFEEVADLLQVLSTERPLLLILDDLHWADISSLSLLFHLGRRLAGSRILIVGAYRPEDVSLGRDGLEHPLASILAEFKRVFGDVWINLSHREGEARAFVDALLDSEPNRLSEHFRERLTHTTKGHPLFAVEMLRDMQERGSLSQDEGGCWVESASITWNALPRRVEGVIERRVGRLDPELRRVLVAASVEGEEFTAEALARVHSVSEEQMVRVLSGDLAGKHRLVQASGVERLGERRIARYRFSHNLFQKYLYDSLDPVQRAYMHDAIGTALEILYEGHTEQVATHLAGHFRAASQFEKAVEYYRQAGDAAARVYANTEAIAHYSQALELAGQVETDGVTLTLLYTRLGRALELDSQFGQVLATYAAMEALARRRGDRRMELMSLMARATIQSVPTAVHDPERARLLGSRALSLAAELGDQAAEAEILWVLSVANYFTDRLSQAIECGERSLALARDLGLREQLAHTLNDLGGFVYLYSGHIDRSIPALAEAGELWRALGNTPMLVDSLGGSSIAHLFAGDLDRAIALSTQAYEISRFIENLWGQSYSRWSIGDAFRARGEYSRAIEASEECIRLGKLAGFLASQTYTRLTLAMIYGDLWALDRAWELANAAQAVVEEHGLRGHSARVLGVQAHLHVLGGEFGQAQALIDQAKKAAFRESWAVFYLAVMRAEVELMLAIGDHRRALVAADDLVAHLHEYGMHMGLPHALYWQGMALLGLGQAHPARDCLLEARAEAERKGSRRTLWPVLSALADLEHNPSAARSLRSEAQEMVGAIAHDIHDSALRASFLSRPDVRAVHDAFGPEQPVDFRREK